MINEVGPTARWFRYQKFASNKYLWVPVLVGTCLATTYTVLRYATVEKTFEIYCFKLAARRPFDILLYLLSVDFMVAYATAEYVG